MTNNHKLTRQQPKIFLIEDDLALASLVSDYLSKHRFEVVVNHTGQGVMDRLASEHIDLILLDLMLPSISGMDLCRMIRADYATPLIMFTAQDDDLDQMLGLELGADDYIIKPVVPRLLLSRIRAVMRRVIHRDASSSIDIVGDKSELRVGDLVVNPNCRSAAIADIPLDLSSAEFDLLLVLAEGAGSVIKRELMVNKLRGFAYNGLDRSIDRRVSRLRKKIQAANGHQDMIKTIRGKGYQLCLDGMVIKR